MDYRLSKRLADQPTRRLILLIPFIFLFHELEEWNNSSWEIANFAISDHPSLLAIRLFLLAISAFGFFIVWLATRFKNRKITAYLLVPFVSLTVLNGAQHIIWTLAFLSYSPGFIFGGLIGVPLGCYALYRFLKERSAHPLYVGLFGILVLFAAAQTILLGHQKPPLIMALYPIANWLAGLVTS